MGQLFWQRRYEELIELGEQATIDQPGGREAEARALARGNIDWHEAGLARTEELSWAPSLSKACALVVLEQAEAALDVLETLPERSGVPRLPWLLDLACFDRLQEEPRYRAVVAGDDSQIRALRERLPDTLARHGLSVNPEPE